MGPIRPRFGLSGPSHQDFLWIFDLSVSEVQTSAEIEASPMRKEDVLQDQRPLGRLEFNERLDVEIEALRKVLRNHYIKRAIPLGKELGLVWAFCGYQ